MGVIPPFFCLAAYVCNRQYISGVGNVVGGVLSTTCEVITDKLGPITENQFDDLEISLDEARDEFYSLLNDTGKEELDPEYLESQAERSANDAKEGAREMAKNPSKAEAKVEDIFRNTKNRFRQSFEAIDKQALAIFW